MYTYCFGSVCRGELTSNSDIDMLIISDKKTEDLNTNKFSIYKESKIEKLWQDGNPFAWHLFNESKLVFSQNGKDFLRSLGEPKKYSDCLNDCIKFSEIFNEASDSLRTTDNSLVLDLSVLFLAIRNFATCFSLGMQAAPTFARNSALNLGDKSLKITKENYEILERARILSTRGIGVNISQTEADSVLTEINDIKLWMITLLKEVKNVRI